MLPDLSSGAAQQRAIAKDRHLVLTADEPVEPCAPFGSAVDPRPERKAERRKREQEWPIQEQAKAHA
jgi:hypothetical protein